MQIHSPYPSLFSRWSTEDPCICHCSWTLLPPCLAGPTICPVTQWRTLGPSLHGQNRDVAKTEGWIYSFLTSQVSTVVTTSSSLFPWLIFVNLIWYQFLLIPVSYNHGTETVIFKVKEIQSFFIFNPYISWISQQWTRIRRWKNSNSTQARSWGTKAGQGLCPKKWLRKQPRESWWQSGTLFS